MGLVGAGLVWWSFEDCSVPGGTVDCAVGRAGGLPRLGGSAGVVPSGTSAGLSRSMATVSSLSPRRSRKVLGPLSRTS